MAGFWGFVHNVVIHPLYWVGFFGKSADSVWLKAHDSTARWAGYEK